VRRRLVVFFFIVGDEGVERPSYHLGDGDGVGGLRGPKTAGRFIMQRGAYMGRYGEGKTGRVKVDGKG
jgi:hypothetical protein